MSLNHLNDQDPLLSLRNYEDHFVERLISTAHPLVCFFEYGKARSSVLHSLAVDLAFRL
jgi:hypothetical protein